MVSFRVFFLRRIYETRNQTTARCLPGGIRWWRPCWLVGPGRGVGFPEHHGPMSAICARVPSCSSHGSSDDGCGRMTAPSNDWFRERLENINRAPVVRRSLSPVYQSISLMRAGGTCAISRDVYDQRTVARPWRWLCLVMAWWHLEIVSSSAAPPPCQISPPSVQRVAPAGRKTSESASE